MRSLGPIHILITGAAGFIGQSLAAALLERGDLTHLTLTDVVEPQMPAKSSGGVKVDIIKADLTSKETCESLFTADVDCVYMMHGIMSGLAEANLELGLRVNIDSTRLIMDTLRNARHGAKIIFPSSLAVFGQSNGLLVTESTMPLPSSSYGAEKLICEILLNEYSRRGFLDGRILRLPTIIVRPGAPSGAASSFCSGIIREPLKGETSVLPVPKDLELWVCSTRTVVKNLLLARDIPRERFDGKLSRVINLPGITVRVDQMLEALANVGGTKAQGLVEERRDPLIEQIVGSWPARFDTAWAEELGFLEDGSLDKTIREYIEDYGH